MKLLYSILNDILNKVRSNGSEKTSLESNVRGNYF